MLSTFCFSHPTLLTGTLLLILGCSLVQKLFCNTSLSNIPSIHWSVKATRAHHLYITYFSSVKTDYYEAHLGRSGSGVFQPMLRISPNEISMMSIEGVKTAFDGGFERSSWYNVFANFGYGDFKSSAGGSISLTTDHQECITCSHSLLSRLISNENVYLHLRTRRRPYLMRRCRI